MTQRKLLFSWAASGWLIACGVLLMGASAGRLIYNAVLDGPGVELREGATLTALAGSTVDLADATVMLPKGSGLARFAARALSGEDLSITALGDSILEGNTVTHPATDGAIIRLGVALEAQYDIAVTVTNHASSGATVARAFINSYVADALAENADLYVIGFGKNDIGADGAATPVPGYPLDSSAQQAERIIRLIRKFVPKADILLFGTNPYTSGEEASNNTRLRAYNVRMHRLAALYGCEYVDGYAPFVALGDFSAYMDDSTHPNTLGHQLMADTMAAHFPATARPVVSVGQPTNAGFGSQVALLNDDIPQRGWETKTNPGAGTYGSWSQAGAGWSANATTTAGAYIEAVIDGTEVFAQLSTTTEHALVADIVVDGVTVQSAVSFTAGKKGTYWVPIALGLSPGAHTVRVVLVSGTLECGAMAWTVATNTRTGMVVVPLPTTTAPASITLTSSYQTMLTGVQTIALPPGWLACDVFATGLLGPRLLATTTTNRTIAARLYLNSATTGAILTMDMPPTTVNAYQPQLQFAHLARNLTASFTVDIQARVTSADTDKTTITNRHISLLLIRTK